MPTKYELVRCSTGDATADRFGLRGSDLSTHIDTLRTMWKDEYAALPTLAHVVALAIDWQHAEDENRRDYVRNIGRGNLGSYADALLVCFHLGDVDAIVRRTRTYATGDTTTTVYRGRFDRLGGWLPDLGARCGYVDGGAWHIGTFAAPDGTVETTTITWAVAR